MDCGSRRNIDVARGSIILIFGFSGRDVADGLQQPTMVEPVDSFERSVLNGFEAAPGSASADHLHFVKAVDHLGQSVVVAVADTADLRLDVGLGETLGVLDRHVLSATERMAIRSLRLWVWITAAVMLWNTFHLDHPVQHLPVSGVEVPSELPANVLPPG